MTNEVDSRLRISGMTKKGNPQLFFFFSFSLPEKRLPHPLESFLSGSKESRNSCKLEKDVIKWGKVFLRS